MFNSITFGSTKFNSVLDRQAVTPTIPPSGGGVTLRKRVFKKHFFDIVGTKLISKKHFFEIIGFLLLNNQSSFNINGKILDKISEDILLKGKVKHSFKTQQEILGFVKFYQENHLAIKYRAVKDIILVNELYALYGKKLWYSTHFNAIKHLKKVYCKQDNLINGKKDISEILKVLDLLDLEE